MERAAVLKRQPELFFTQRRRAKFMRKGETENTRTFCIEGDVFLDGMDASVRLWDVIKC